MSFPDWRPAPNIRDAPDLYELENAAIDPADLVFDEMRRLAPWTGRTLVDLGCGTGYWLPRYASEAMWVVGIEPDAELLSAASARVTALPNVETRAGSAEHLPFDDGTVDVVHARFAYFWGDGCEGGVTETMRVLRDGGSLVVVDNDHTRGEFAELLRACDAGFTQRRQPEIDQWWADRGAERFTVLSSWEFASRADLEAVLGNEFRDGVADPWLAANLDRRSLSYGFVLYRLAKQGRR